MRNPYLYEPAWISSQAIWVRSSRGQEAATEYLLRGLEWTDEVMRAGLCSDTEWAEHHATMRTLMQCITSAHLEWRPV